MALDEALLHAARQPTLRLYRWEPPTVSLGFFQCYPAVRALVPGNVPIVRRITGGGAIWHEHEVTYCLAGALGRDGFPARTRDLYPLLHGAVLARLSRRGIEVRRQERTEGDRRYEHEPRCFASPATDDIMHQKGGKMLGSAARQRADRVLIHGSLKLASNPWDIDTVTGCGLTWEDAANLMLEAVCEALGLEAKPGDLSAEEIQAWDRIHRERYGTPQWVEERIGPKA
jgi:lipoate-protein ligase A